ncbi:MAG: SpoVG family protein [Planctomycetaceae bacterium]
MEITEVRIKIVPQTQDRLLGFCSLTFDNAFVVRDLKIILGGKGPFVAMPSRKLTDRCRKCGGKNPYRAAYCNQCGVKLLDTRAPRNPDGRAKLYADIAHPINSTCREMIQSAVILAYEEEQRLAALPGYVCRYDDLGEDHYVDYEEDQDDSVDTGARGSLSTDLSNPAASDVLKESSVAKVSDQGDVSTQEHGDDFAESDGGTTTSGHISRAGHDTPRAPHVNLTLPTENRNQPVTKQSTNDDFGAGLV